MKLQIIAIIITALMLLMIVAMSATPNITGGCKTEIDTTQVKHIINQQNKSL
ncbi:MAG: hypothetical protein IJ341_08005 [Bacteroidales bacterium]|nr:hypothetical protein [Bacteroidales bacterium]